MNPLVIGGGVFLLIILIVVAVMFSSGGGEAAAPSPQAEEPKTTEEKVEASAVSALPQPPGDEEEKPEQEDEAQPTEEEKQDEAAAEVATEEVSEDAPDIDPMKIPSLVGYFTADSFDERANVWKDKSGNDNHADEVKGEPEVVDEDGIKWVRGGKDAGVRFPTTCMSRGKKFTLVHVARYDGQLGGRIFDGVDCAANFLSGYHWAWWGGTSRAQAYGGSHRSGTGWIAHPYIIPDEQKDNFNVTVEWKHKARYNGIQRSGKTNGRAMLPTQMSINWGCATTSPNQQQTDWAVAEVLFFNKELDLETAKKLETYLFKKYKLKKPVRAGVVPWNYYKLETGAWWSPYGDCAEPGCADQYRLWDKMGGECGDEGSINHTHMHRHWRNHERGSNGAFWFWNSCITGVDNSGGVEKKTKYVNITDNAPTSEKLKVLTDMNCRETGINSYEYDLSSDKSRMRLKYKCSGTPIAEDSCREIQAARHGLDIQREWKNAFNNERLPQKGPMSAMETQDLNCGAGQVLTKVEYGEDENGGVRLKGRCCSLEDL